MHRLTQQRALEGFVYRGEVGKLVRIMDEELRASDAYIFALVGPKWCGKTMLVKEILQDRLANLVARRGDEYAAIDIELAPQGNIDIPKLPQEEKVALNALKATLATMASYEASKLIVSQGINAPAPEIAGGEVQRIIYEYLYKRGLKRELERTVVAIRLDGIDALKREGAILGKIYEAVSVATKLLHDYGVKKVVVAIPMRVSTYYKVGATMPGDVDRYFILGFSLDDFWNYLFNSFVEDESRWRARGGPEPYEAWRLTGGIPRLFEMLYTGIMESYGFNVSEFVKDLDNEFWYTDVLAKLKSAGRLKKLVEVAQDPDALSEPEYAELRKLLIRSELVAPVGYNNAKLIMGNTWFGPTSNMGKHYTWIIPALREHLFEAALRGYVEKMRVRARVGLSL